MVILNHGGGSHLLAFVQKPPELYICLISPKLLSSNMAVVLHPYDNCTQFDFDKWNLTKRIDPIRRIQKLCSHYDHGKREIIIGFSSNVKL